MIRIVIIAVAIYAAAIAATFLAIGLAPRPAAADEPQSINRDAKSERAKSPARDIRVFATCRSA